MSDAPPRIPAPARFRAARVRLVVTLFIVSLAGFLWARSIIHTDTIWFCTVGGQFNELQLSNGIVALRVTDDELGPAEAFVVRYFHSRAALNMDGDLALRQLPFFDPTRTLFGPSKPIDAERPFGEPGDIGAVVEAADESLAGFNLVRVPGNAVLHGIVIGVPYYALFLVLLVLCVWRARRFLVLRKRARRGLCMECAYNIGHSSERCPECGTPIDRATRPERRWPRYAVATALVSLLVIAGFVAGRTSGHLAGALPLPEVDPVAAKLEGVRATLKTGQIDLEQMITVLRKSYGATIKVDWDSSRLSDPRGDETVSLDMENVELCEALVRLAEQVHTMSFDIEGASVVLNPDGNYITRVYNDQRLVALVEKEWEWGLGTTILRGADYGEYASLPIEQQNRAKIRDGIAWELEEAIARRAERPDLISRQARFEDGMLIIRTTRYGQLVASRRLAELIAEAERTAAVMEGGKK